MGDIIAQFINYTKLIEAIKRLPEVKRANKEQAGGDGGDNEAQSEELLGDT